ncbi:MAG TPA: hypothetical protein VEJ86_02535 [Candidatus Binataceae bacterium]|nr:hypothetical protein [Candidatus Binataceae bacterium]
MASIKLSLSQGFAVYRSDLLRFFQDQAPLRILEIRLSSAEGVVFQPLRWLVDDQDHEALAAEVAALIAAEGMSVSIATSVSAPGAGEIPVLAAPPQRTREIRRIGRVVDLPAEPQRPKPRRVWPLVGRLVASD